MQGVLDASVAQAFWPGREQDAPHQHGNSLQPSPTQFHTLPSGFSTMLPSAKAPSSYLSQKHAGLDQASSASKHVSAAWKPTPYAPLRQVLSVESASASGKAGVHAIAPLPAAADNSAPLLQGSSGMVLHQGLDPADRTSPTFSLGEALRQLQQEQQQQQQQLVVTDRRLSIAARRKAKKEHRNSAASRADITTARVAESTPAHTTSAQLPAPTQPTLLQPLALSSSESSPSTPHSLAHGDRYLPPCLAQGHSAQPAPGPAPGMGTSTVGFTLLKPQQAAVAASTEGKAAEIVLSSEQLSPVTATEAAGLPSPTLTAAAKEEEDFCVPEGAGVEQLRSTLDALLTAAGACRNPARQPVLMSALESLLPRVAAAGISTKYGRKVLQRLRAVGPARDELHAALAAAQAHAATANAVGCRAVVFADASATTPAAQGPLAVLESALEACRSVRCLLEPSLVENADGLLRRMMDEAQLRRWDAMAAQLAAAGGCAGAGSSAGDGSLASPAASGDGGAVLDALCGADMECAVCMAATKNTACVPCGHVCMCKACADDVQQRCGWCPVCRTELITVLELLE